MADPMTYAITGMTKGILAGVKARKETEIKQKEIDIKNEQLKLQKEAGERQQKRLEIEEKRAEEEGLFKERKIGIEEQELGLKKQKTAADINKGLESQQINYFKQAEDALKSRNDWFNKSIYTTDPVKKDFYKSQQRITESLYKDATMKNQENDIKLSPLPTMAPNESNALRKVIRAQSVSEVVDILNQLDKTSTPEVREFLKAQSKRRIRDIQPLEVISQPNAE